MNELIQKLLIQSEVFNKDGTILKDVTGYELNKFAQLIVQQCIKECEDTRDYDCVKVAETLREHFGVK